MHIKMAMKDFTCISFQNPTSIRCLENRFITNLFVLSFIIDTWVIMSANMHENYTGGEEKNVCLTVPWNSKKASSLLIE